MASAASSRDMVSSSILMRSAVPFMPIRFSTLSARSLASGISTKGFGVPTARARFVGDFEFTVEIRLKVVEILVH